MIKQNLMENRVYQQSILHDIFAEKPLGYMDVGARGGVHALVEPLHQQVNFLGFEPDRKECELLNANIELRYHWKNFYVLPYALSDRSATQTLKIMSAATNTSLLTPDPALVERYNMHAKWHVVEQTPLNVVPLDELIATQKQIDFSSVAEIVKIDTQGTEYEILKGASNLLKKHTLCIVTEVEFFPIYQGQKLFSDVEILLRQLGFSFYGFMTLHTRSKKQLDKSAYLGKERLFYADAVFFKDPFTPSNQINERQHLVLITAAILTGYYDFALELIQTAKIAEFQKQCLVQLVKNLAFKNPEETKTAVTNLVSTIEKDYKRANVHVGKFIDHLNFPDFEDVNLSSA